MERPALPTLQRRNPTGAAVAKLGPRPSETRATMSQTTPATGAVARQQAIYSAGMSGSRPTVPTDYAALEAAAEKAMSEEGYAYIAGGAGRESTMAANRRAFERWRCSRVWYVVDEHRQSGGKP